MPDTRSLADLIRQGRSDGKIPVTTDDVEIYATVFRIWVNGQPGKRHFKTRDQIWPYYNAVKANDSKAEVRIQYRKTDGTWDFEPEWRS